jgi:hypothetical protein
MNRRNDIHLFNSHGHLSLDKLLFLELKLLLGCELMLVDVTIFFLLPWICDGAACASTMVLSLNS